MVVNLVLKHQVNNQTFYSLYGHLKTPHKVQLGDKILAGQELALIGKEVIAVDGFVICIYR